MHTTRPQVKPIVAKPATVAPKTARASASTTMEGTSCGASAAVEQEQVRAPARARRSAANPLLAVLRKMDPAALATAKAAYSLANPGIPLGQWICDRIFEGATAVMEHACGINREVGGASMSPDLLDINGKIRTMHLR